MSSLYYKTFSLFPNSAVNARHGQDTYVKPIQGLDFKWVYKQENLYTSMTLHTSLGDPEVEYQIEMLKNNIPSILLENFKEEYLLKSKERYFLDFVSHELKTQATIQKKLTAEEDLKTAFGLYRNGFTRLKFKMNLNFFLDQQMYFDFLKLHESCEFIFDFNSCAQLKDFQKIQWPRDVLQRSYWEDPIDMQNLDELTALKALGFQMILDQKNMTFHQRLKPLAEIFDIIAVKPTKESVKEVLQIFPKSKLLITTNMGDELDHIIAAHWANYIFTHWKSRFFGAGLYTRHFFRTPDIQEFDALSSLKPHNKQELDPKVRTSFLNLKEKDKLRGWGLDKELARAEWIYLRDLDAQF